MKNSIYTIIQNSIYSCPLSFVYDCSHSAIFSECFRDCGIPFFECSTLFSNPFQSFSYFPYGIFVIYLGLDLVFFMEFVKIENSKGIVWFRAQFGKDIKSFKDDQNCTSLKDK